MFFSSLETLYGELGSLTCAMPPVNHTDRSEMSITVLVSVVVGCTSFGEHKTGAYHTWGR